MAAGGERVIERPVRAEIRAAYIAADEDAVERRRLARQIARRHMDARVVIGRIL